MLDEILFLELQSGDVTNCSFGERDGGHSHVRSGSLLDLLAVERAQNIFAADAESKGGQTPLLWNVAAAGREEGGEQKECAGSDAGCAGWGCVEHECANGTQRAGKSAECACEDEGEAPALGEQQRGCAGGDEHRDHENGADGFEGCDAGAGDEREHGVVHDPRGNAHARCELGMETDEFDLSGGEQQRDDADDEDDQEQRELARDFARGREREGEKFAVQDTAGIEVNLLRGVGDHENAQGKERGEDDAQRGILMNATDAREACGCGAREQTNGECAGEHDERVACAGEEERCGKTREDGVRERVAQHAEAAEHEVCAEQAASGATESGGGDDPPVGARDEEMEGGVGQGE